MRKPSALLLSAGLACAAQKASAAKRVQVYAHRGARAFAPENTLPAYRTGLRVGADFVDMDVVLTEDGEVLVGHDPVLNSALARGADGRWVEPDSVVVADHSLADLKRYDVGRLDPKSAYANWFPDQLPVDGTRMPTLREVIDYVDAASQRGASYQIEMKTDPTIGDKSADPELFAKALYKILKEKKLVDRAEIQAFDWRCLYALTKLDPKVRTAFLTSRDKEFANPLWTGGKLVKDFGSLPKMVKALGGFAWEPEDAELTKEALDDARALGLKVVVWTWPERSGSIFDAQRIAKLIDWGVDGIITDDPGRLISMLAARGLPVPPRYEAP